MKLLLRYVCLTRIPKFSDESMAAMVKSWTQWNLCCIAGFSKFWSGYITTRIIAWTSCWDCWATTERFGNRKKFRRIWIALWHHWAEISSRKSIASLRNEILHYQKYRMMTSIYLPLYISWCYYIKSEIKCHKQIIFVK